MTDNEPTVGQFMASNPIYIEADQTAEQAKKVMEDLEIRHLPVIKQGKVVGIVTDRDLKLAFSPFSRKATRDPATVNVGEICTPNIYQVAPDTPLKDVVHELARNRIGSVVVTENEELVGIFTTVDACMALYVYLDSGGELGNTTIPR